jgi:magnesium-transporting ATPase (P-type)
MLEARLFSELGMSPPYEPPFDLLVSVPIRILSLLWAVVAIFGGIASIFLGVIIKNDPLLRLGFYILAVLLIVIGLPVLVGSIVALVRSALTWRRRKARLRELWTASG